MSFGSIFKHIIFLLSILPESPRWLIAKGRGNRGHEILRKIAKRNGNKFPEGVTVTVPVSLNKKKSFYYQMIKLSSTIINRLLHYDIFFNSCH